MRRQRHRKERSGRARRIFVLTDGSGTEHPFRSKRALLVWARGQAKKLLPAADAPSVHLSARGTLLVHPSKADYEAWVVKKRGVRLSGRHAPHLVPALPVAADAPPAPHGALRLGRVASRCETGGAS